MPKAVLSLRIQELAETLLERRALTHRAARCAEGSASFSSVETQRKQQR